MSFDYGPLAKLAEAQMKDKGRSVTLRLETATFLPATGVTTLVNTDSPVNAVFTDFEAGQIDGTLILQGDKKVLIAAREATPTTGHKIVDGARTWNIVSVKEITPGPTALLFEVHARDA